MDTARTAPDTENAYAHLEAGEWAAARHAFAAAVEIDETPEALEGLGLAHWWLNEAREACHAQERAYRLYVARDDPCSAARMAIHLARNYTDYRGEPAVGNGWLRRAHRMLAEQPECEEHGWLRYNEGLLALFDRLDVEAARAAGEAAAEIGRRVGSVDVEMLGIALEGLALVSAGRVDEGMARLDESSTAVVSGEVGDRAAAGDACCLMIFGCERVRDFDRAAQWCRHIRELAERIGQRSYLAVCRTHYASVLISCGRWTEAEAELEVAAQDLGDTYPGMLPEALSRYGELRRRQGRYDEAESLLRRANPHPEARIAMGRLALDRGRTEDAIETLRSLLRQLPDADLTSRVAALEPLVEACVAAGRVDEARSAAQELAAAAGTIGTSAMHAAALRARGLVAEAAHDPDAACRSLEDAVNLLAGTGLPFETGVVRGELGRALRRAGRSAAAEREAALARELFASLGAAHMTERMERTSSRQKDEPSAEKTAESLLTRRETQVLRLIAEGLTNREIAGRLIVSEHTVHRHVANILTKLDAPTRAAAVAAAARARLL